MTENNFVRLAQINVGDKIEKKNGLSYLSWAWAVDQLMRADPTANWSYGDPSLYGETMMVHCTVTAFGKPMTAHLPVMNYKNQPIPKPNAFEVNTAMQRCLVKAIALHGLGLYIYAGEDLPMGEADPKDPAPAASNGSSGASGAGFNKECFDTLPLAHQEHIRALAANVVALLDEERFTDAYLYVEEQKLDDQEKPALWHLLDSKQRAAIKKASESFRGAKSISRAERKAA